MVIKVSSLDAKIEVGFLELVGEVKSDIGLAERTQSPLRLMMCIDIEGGIFLILDGILEVEECTGMSESSLHIAIVLAGALEGLFGHRHGRDIMVGGEDERIVGVLESDNILLLHLYFLRLLDGRLVVTLNRYAAHVCAILSSERKGEGCCCDAKKCSFH